MKTTALTITLLCALGAYAYAGPEPTGKEMKQVAPVPTPCPTWTGFEIGGFGSYVYGVADTHLDLTGSWEEFHDAEVQLQDRGERSLGTSGGEIGGFIGYNYQFAGNWVIGAEFDGGYMFLRDSKAESVFVADGFEEEFNARASFKTHYLLTLGGKIGYAFCHWLPYFTGGVAWADTDLHARLALPDSDLVFDGSTSDTKTGWFIGAGLEYKFNNPHWRLRTQYQYCDFGNTGFTRQDLDGEGFISHRSVDLREHVVQFAIVYGF